MVTAARQFLLAKHKQADSDAEHAKGLKALITVVVESDRKLGNKLRKLAATTAVETSDHCHRKSRKSRRKQKKLSNQSKKLKKVLEQSYL